VHQRGKREGEDVRVVVSDIIMATTELGGKNIILSSTASFLPPVVSVTAPVAFGQNPAGSLGASLGA